VPTVPATNVIGVAGDTPPPLQPFASQNAAIQKAIELWRQLKAYL
jgi:hypothetical protein